MKYILHFSDLHFSNDDFIQNFENEYKKFENLIKQNNIKAHCIFLTGDMLTFDNLEYGYGCLKIFLDRIKKLFNLKSENIFYISGNHENLSTNKNDKQNKLFYNFILNNCNKKCVNDCFNETIEGHNFIFFNSFVNKTLTKWEMSLNITTPITTQNNIFILHANPKHYSTPINLKGDVICGHKIDELKCDKINNISNNFTITIGSKDGFCSGKYIAGLYEVNENSDIIYAKTLNFTSN